MPETDLADYLDSLEENFLNGKIPYDTYRKTILAYELWRESPETQGEN